MVIGKDAPVYLLLALALTSACSPVTPPPAADEVIPAVAPSRTPNPSSTPSVTITISVTPSPDIPLPSYPNLALPGKSRLVEIFRAGVQSGMRRGVFSKVGDSITANGMFLVPFGSGGYFLGEYGYLQNVIDFFSRENAREENSFANDSLAARTSWRAEHVLDPAKNKPPCEAGESPLLCEFRIVRPAVAVILLGTNDAMAPTRTFEESMQSIVLLSLNRGIIPILTTLPDLVGRDVAPYNAVIRGLASRWEVPLIDLSAALASLPNRGLAPDGIHLSWVEPAVFEPQFLKHGMTVRNILTLQALDAVWRSFPSDEEA
jgi:hypothetical protein